MNKIKITLIFTSLAWTFVNLYQALQSPTVINLTSFVGIVPIIAALYSEIDWLYIHWNKFRAYIFLKTVSFTPKSSKFLKETITLNQLEKQIRSVLKENDYSINEATFSKTHEDIYIDIESTRGIRNKLSISLHPESNGQRLIFKADYQLAYRDVKKQWDSFLSLRDNLFSIYSREESSKERFDVIIKTDKHRKYNPFYRMTVRHLGKKEVKKFDLQFKDNDLSVKTTLNKIYGTSNNRQDIEKLINEYIPLSRL
ncbi:TPA: hypothetical protein ACL8T8_000911 [Streptococcus pneumoniae]|uniref:hypothetical protein n=1 Tax=Streptococcus pneumoniae TaxID=1313 RepID=UPI001C65D918|nr:hypothetical protein [Streptococcus pneumoniae]MBW8150879.1 hypothetical protein [Streptococcus pneumoniae]MDV8473120.1 hypothetical protein [Streptococcus pneumoniae]HET5664213.1 hypothetical protein [Streptococcus pneumoniae]HEW1290448.1 hypothetical protein [Streptococcus pneumoniae]